jgi:hypothetical protein
MSKICRQAGGAGASAARRRPGAETPRPAAARAEAGSSRVRARRAAPPRAAPQRARRWARTSKRSATGLENSCEKKALELGCEARARGAAHARRVARARRRGLHERAAAAQARSGGEAVSCTGSAARANPSCCASYVIFAERAVASCGVAAAALPLKGAQTSAREVPPPGEPRCGRSGAAEATQRQHAEAPAALKLGTRVATGAWRLRARVAAPETRARRRSCVAHDAANRSSAFLAGGAPGEAMGHRRRRAPLRRALLASAAAPCIMTMSPVAAARHAARSCRRKAA